MARSEGDLTKGELESNNARRLLSRIHAERAKGVRAHLLTDDESALVTVGLRHLAQALDGTEPDSVTAARLLRRLG